MQKGHKRFRLSLLLKWKWNIKMMCEITTASIVQLKFFCYVAVFFDTRDISISGEGLQKVFTTTFNKYVRYCKYVQITLDTLNFPTLDWTYTPLSYSLCQVATCNTMNDTFIFTKICHKKARPVIKILSWHI